MRGELNGCRQRPHLEECATVRIGLRDARCTRLIGVSSPLSILYMSQIVWSHLIVSFATNGVLDSSTSTEFLISVYFILARYRNILIEHSKDLRYFMDHSVQHPKIPHSAHRLQCFVWISEHTAVIFLFMLTVPYKVGL